MPGKFLSAEWRKLVIFNFEADPALLQKFLPAHTQLDTYKGRHLVSLVGFRFKETRVWRIKWPWHHNFLEVNLRFYVKRYVNGEWRRGVVFIQEIVPKRLISLMANMLYNENYKSLSVADEVLHSVSELSVKYAVVKKGQHIFGAQAGAQAWGIAENSIEEFVTEHYYGYSRAGSNKTLEYGVEHPRWSCYPVKYYFLKVDFAVLYGEEFKFLNMAKPHSVLLSEGSEIVVKKAVKLS
jgi:uncharacterized protein